MFAEGADCVPVGPIFSEREVDVLGEPGSFGKAHLKGHSTLQYPSAGIGVFEPCDDALHQYSSAETIYRETGRLGSFSEPVFERLA